MKNGIEEKTREKRVESMFTFRIFVRTSSCGMIFSLEMFSVSCAVLNFVSTADNLSTQQTTNNFNRRELVENSIKFGHEYCEKCNNIYDWNSTTY